MDTFAALIERAIASDVSALVPVGTTGESATLSHDEHRDLVSTCVRVAQGRVPVIAGACSNSTAESIELVSHAKKAGAHAALTICPYYNRPSQNGLYAHFKSINDAVEFPLILYNVPSRTASDLLPETVAHLAELPNIIGLKDASARLDRVPQHRHSCGEGFLLLSGDDMSALGFNAMGGQGCISVTCNVAPEHCVQMHDAMQAGDFRRAEKLNRKLARLHRALFKAPNPGPAKYAMSILGLCSPETRLPIMAVEDPDVQEEIRAAMIEAGVLREPHTA